MQTRPPLQVHPLGASFALVSAVTGAVIVTNDFGRQIALGWNRGDSPSRMAEALAEHPLEQPEARAAIEQVLSDWDAAGLLHRDRPDFPQPVPYQPATGYRLSLGGGGGSVTCDIPDPVLAGQMDTILGHMRVESGDITLEAIPAGNGFAIFREGQALSGRITLDAARFVLLRECAEILCGPDQVAAVFHAGAVALNGQALLICGDSGQGKSTLTLGLVAAGCAYLGDDHIPLHRNGRDVMCFPTAAGVKPGSWNLPEVQALLARYGQCAQTSRRGVRYVPLHQAGNSPVGTPVPARALIFPSFAPDTPPVIERMTPEQALILAMQAGSRQSGSHKGDLAPLADFLTHVPAYRLCYGSSEYSVAACLDLLRSSPC